MFEFHSRWNYLLVLAAVVVLMGCVSSPSPANSTTSPSAQAAAPAPAVVAPSPSVEIPAGASAKEIVRTAYANAKKSNFQIEYGKFDFFGFFQVKLIEAKDGTDLLAYNDIWPTLGSENDPPAKTKMFFLNDAWTECVDGACSPSDGETSFRIQVITSGALDESKLDEIPFLDTISTRTVAGRSCHEITALDPEDESSKLSMCFDDELGAVLALGMESFLGSISVTAEDVKTQVDRSLFVPTP